MTTQITTFEEWQATRKAVEDMSAHFGGDEPQPGFEYEPGAIMDTGGKDAHGQPFPRYHLIIERSEWTSDNLADLERILWDNFARDCLELGAP